MFIIIIGRLINHIFIIIVLSLVDLQIIALCIVLYCIVLYYPEQSEFVQRDNCSLNCLKYCEDVHPNPESTLHKTIKNRE